MTGQGLFVPAALLALWTIAVSIILAIARRNAVRRGEIKAGYFKLYPTSDDLPDRLVILDRHFRNLLEMPVLFYAAVVSAFAIGVVTPPVVVLSWGYLITRLIHSAIHLTTNHVLHRLIAFASGVVMLGSLWILILLAVI